MKTLRSDDRGVTLIELLVSLTIMSIIIGAVAVTFTSITASARSAQERNRVSNEARTIMETIGRNVRGAVIVPGRPEPAVRTASSTMLKVTTQVGGTADPYLITMELSGVLMYEKRIPPDPPDFNFAGAGTVIRTLTNELVAGSDQVFRYYTVDSTGAIIELVPDITGFLSLTQRQQVELVKVTLAVRPETAPVTAQPVEVRGEFRIPNNTFRSN